MGRKERIDHSRLRGINRHLHGWRRDGKGRRPKDWDADMLKDQAKLLEQELKGKKNKR